MKCRFLKIPFPALTEAATGGVLQPRVFLDILQNSQENTCAGVSFLIKLQARPATLLKKRLWRRCFPVNFAKFLRTPFLTENLQWLLLNHVNLKVQYKIQKNVNLTCSLLDLFHFLVFSLHVNTKALLDI